MLLLLVSWLVKQKAYFMSLSLYVYVIATKVRESKMAVLVGSISFKWNLFPSPNSGQHSQLPRRWVHTREINFLSQFKYCWAHCRTDMLIGNSILPFVKTLNWDIESNRLPLLWQCIWLISGTWSRHSVKLDLAHSTALTKCRWLHWRCY